MRNESHTTGTTFTGILREEVEAFRKANGWSRETVVMHIVEAHEQIGGPANTGIVFDPPSRDTFERAKVNADRVFRWLDDVSKDTNHCPPNFIRSILSALPMDRRIALVNRWLLPLDMSCRPLNHTDSGEPIEAHVHRFQTIVRAASSAQTSVAELLDGIDPGELEHAQVALSEAVHHMQNELHLVEQRLAAKAKPGAPS